jgi:hypothetical protein
MADDGPSPQAPPAVPDRSTAGIAPAVGPGGPVDVDRPQRQNPPTSRRRRMGLPGLVLTLVLVLVGGAAATGAVLYATDYTMEADVTDKDCTLALVSVETRLFGIDHDVAGVPVQQCSILQVGDFVEYRIRSKHTTLYRDGQCIYDSETGTGCGAVPLGNRPLL